MIWLDHVILFAMWKGVKKIYFLKIAKILVHCMILHFGDVEFLTVSRIYQITVLFLHRLHDLYTFIELLVPVPDIYNRNTCNQLIKSNFQF